jgi:hypothetical protein
MPPQFRRVVRVALTLPDVELATRYDGSPVLQLRGCFMAGPATHPSAEADSLVVRADPDTRALWLEDAPETYYVTECYRRHPVVLVRVACLDDAALRDVLATSWRLTSLKARPRRAGGRGRAGLAGASPDARNTKARGAE